MCLVGVVLQQAEGNCLGRGWSLSISYNSGVRCKVMAGIELPWNVILSQWTGFYKLGRNGFSWHSTNIAPM